VIRWDALSARARSFFRVDLDPVLSIPNELSSGSWDKWMVGATCGLLVLGLTMVYSATSPLSTRPSAYLESHLIKIVSGLVAFAIGSRIDYHRWGRWAPGLYVLGLASLLLVYVPGVGHSAGNARRWMSLGGFTLQPAEIVRLGLVVYMALLLSKPRAQL